MSSPFILVSNLNFSENMIRITPSILILSLFKAFFFSYLVLLNHSGLKNTLFSQVFLINLSFIFLRTRVSPLPFSLKKIWALNCSLLLLWRVVSHLKTKLCLNLVLIFSPSPLYIYTQIPPFPPVLEILNTPRFRKHKICSVFFLNLVLLEFHPFNYPFCR